MNELVAQLEHINPVLALGAASLGVAILAAARDRIADSVVTRGHELLQQTRRFCGGDEESDDGDGVPAGERNDELADADAQLSDEEQRLVDAAAGQSAGVVLAVGDGSVALDKLTMYGGNVTIGGARAGAGTAGEGSS
ncbi:hypothetical protein ACF09Y_10360 [Streptomyces massasporeus]|uniref:hypothetical protein n=1 Tax=Streptomyces massasporeus TaxID=67324 RepID=UPI0036FF5809